METTRKTGTNKTDLKRLCLMGLFVALIFLLGQTPLGLIPLGWCNVTLLVIPVAVGTLYMGLKCGLGLGLAFGMTSFLSALLKPSVLVGTLMGASPVLTAIMTFVPRLCVPAVIYFVNKALAGKWRKASMPMACALGSLTNTVLYLGMMLLFYTMLGIDNAKVLAAIGATAGGAGPAEAVAAALIAPPIVAAIRKVGRKA